jgi:hypothetical protein
MRTLLALLMAALTSATSASVIERDGARFETSVSLQGRDLPLRGAGSLRYGLFFRAYVAALYADAVPEHRLLDPATPRRLEIFYFVDLPKARIVNFAEQRLRDLMSEAGWTRLAERVREWHRHFRDVRAGDRYAMHYSQGELSLTFNGEQLVKVADPELATAYFGLWLGDRPIDRGLRDALVGSKPAPHG